MQGYWEPDEKTVMDALKKLNAIQEEYLKKFGEHSLDYVIICDPMWMNADNFNEGSRMLENAIKNDAPIEQIPEEIWNNIVF